MIGCGIGPTRAGCGPRPWRLSNFGAAFVLEAPLVSDQLVGSTLGRLTLAPASSDIVSAADAAGGPVVLSRVAAGRECTYDTSQPFAGRGAVRLSRPDSALRTVTGGANGTNAPHYMASFARAVAVADNVSGFATFILYGQPTATNNGIGSATPPDKFSWGGNVISSSQPATFDTGPHLFESSYDGAELRCYLDGELVFKRTVSITFNGPEGAGFGLLSWYDALRAVQDTMVYRAAFKNGVPSFADRMHLAEAFGQAAHFLPMRIHGKGDSRTLGSGSTPGNDYLTQVVNQFALAGRTVTQVNHGLSGKRSDEIATVVNVVDIGELHSPFRTNVSLLWPGYNDINQYSTAPTTAEAIYANTRSMIDFDRAYRNTVFVMTVPTSGPFETAPAARAMQLAYNDLVRERAVADGAAGVIDLAPLFEPYDSSYYADPVTDTIHFNDASQLLIAQAVHAALAGLP